MRMRPNGSMKFFEDSSAERERLLTEAARRLFSALDPRTLVARLEDAVRDLLGASTTVYDILPDGRTADGDELVRRAAATRSSVTDDVHLRAAACVAIGGHASHVIEVRSGSGIALTEADRLTLDLLAEFFGVAVRSASLVAELEERRTAILELHQVKSDLIAMLAHDFKGPLTSIVGFTELAMELGEVNPDQREYLESVKRIALHLADMASHTLAFSSLERNEIELLLAEVDVAALAHDVAEALHDRRDVRIVTNGRTTLHADARRLRQVLYNLIENAIKYSPGEAPVDVKVYGKGDCLEVSVTDSGIGIPQDELGQIFGRFSRGSNARDRGISGTGFGLYLARQIVELHGGRIAATSAPGEGSTFTVELPVKAPPTPEHLLTVAVLDTERETRSFIAHALHEAGVHVRVEHTVAQLLSWLASHRVDSIAIDVDAVRLTPAEIAQLENECKREGFTIVAVGMAGTNLFERAIALGKPFLVQDLLIALGATRSRPA
jgi:signal transduction histidine kinase